MQATKTRVHVRWMVRRDMHRVLDIEQGSFDFPWSGEEFLRCLRERSCIGMVAENKSEEVLGYMFYELHDNRLHIINFAVDPLDRHKSVGTQMIDKLIGKLSSQRRNRITLEVRESNLAAQLFFKSQGFKATRVLQGYCICGDAREDAYRMKYELREE